jgi:hypothetical protein
MKLAWVYLKHQFLTLTLLVFFTSFPFYLLIQYGPKIPYATYFFVFIVFMLRLLVNNERALKKKYTPLAQRDLTKELKRNPSGQEIFNRVQFLMRSKDFSLLLVGLINLILGILNGQF